MSKVIALVANKESGKSTLATLLEEKYGYKRLAFANPVKEWSEMIIGTWIESLQELVSGQTQAAVPARVLAGALQQSSGDKILLRGLYQGVGGGARQFTYDNVWVDKLVHQIINNSDTPYVIDDCRYLNEMLILHKLGAVLIHINRPGSDGLHLSERVQENVNKLKTESKIDVDLTIDYDSGEQKAKQTLVEFIEKQHASRKF